MVVVCAGTTGYNATVDLRYLWMRQKRLQGSHFANTEQSNQMNELALRGLLDPCLSRAFTYDEIPLAHQLMYENKHPHGNMAVLVGATDFGRGAHGQPPVAIPHPTLPKGDVHTTPPPYPMSEPLPGIAEAAGLIERLGQHEVHRMEQTRFHQIQFAAPRCQGHPRQVARPVACFAHRGVRQAHRHRHRLLHHLLL